MHIACWGGFTIWRVTARTETNKTILKARQWAWLCTSTSLIGDTILNAGRPFYGKESSTWSKSWRVLISTGYFIRWSKMGGRWAKEVRILDVGIRDMMLWVRLWIDLHSRPTWTATLSWRLVMMNCTRYGAVREGVSALSGVLSEAGTRLNVEAPKHRGGMDFGMDWPCHLKFLISLVWVF